MQVTDEMVEAAFNSWFHHTTQARGNHLDAMREAVQAALDVMPKATGGLISAPDRLIPQLVDVTPPQKVHDAADNLPGLTFNLNQQYGGLNEAALKKLRMAMGGSADQAADE